LPFASKEKRNQYQRNYKRDQAAKLRNIKTTGKFKKGDKVKIYNRTSDGKEIFEGTATLVMKLMPAEYAEYWSVQFDSDKEKFPVPRWIQEQDREEKSL
jgi:hypothetical protein